MKIKIKRHYGKSTIEVKCKLFELINSNKIVVVISL